MDVPLDLNALKQAETERSSLKMNIDFRPNSGNLVMFS